MPDSAAPIRALPAFSKNFRGCTISRDQQTDTFKTAKGQNAGFYDNSQNSYAKAQGDVGKYEDQLAKYASGNPYVEGGQFQTDENKTTANTADALARSTGSMLQGQALRTGQNSAGGIAATEEMERQGGRDLSAEQSRLDAERIGNEADYKGKVLQASAVPEQMESTLSDQQGRLAAGALGTQEDAAKQPSWLDEFGGAFGESFGKSLGAGAASGFGAGCWVAAELYGGWGDSRTIMVREWVNTELPKSNLGALALYLYLRFGERVAGLLRRFPSLKAPLFPLFNAALRRAQEVRNGSR